MVEPNPAPPSGQGGPPHGPARKSLVITNYEYVRHVIIRAADENVKLTKMNPFIISKYLESIVGPEPKVNNNRVINATVQKPRTTYTPLRSGDICVHTPDVRTTKTLLRTTKFGDKNVTATIPIGMNTVKGVINMRGFNEMSEDEIVNEMKSANVIACRHFRRPKDGSSGEWTNLNTVTLTFLLPKLPSQVKVGCLVLDVKPFIPNPRRCYVCYKYGHPTKYCRTPELILCGKCKSSTHVSKDCTAQENEYVCINCPNSANHSSLDKQCPTYIHQKEICTVMANENIGFLAAKAKVTPMASSFAGILKTNIKTNFGNDLPCSCKCNCIEKEILNPSSIDKVFIGKQSANPVVTLPNVTPVTTTTLPNVTPTTSVMTSVTSTATTTVTYSVPGPSMPIFSLPSLLNSPSYRSAMGDEADATDTFVDAETILSTPTKNAITNTNDTNYKRQLSFNADLHEGEAHQSKNLKTNNDGSALC